MVPGKQHPSDGDHQPLWPELGGDEAKVWLLLTTIGGWEAAGDTGTGRNHPQENFSAA